MFTWWQHFRVVTIQRKHHKNAVTVTDILYLLTIDLVIVQGLTNLENIQIKKKIKSEHLQLGTRNMYITEWDTCPHKPITWIIHKG